METQDLAIFVSSCDKHCKAWDPFFYLFFKYWPDCPYNIFLVTNFLEYSVSRVESLKIGYDTSWKNTTLLALNKIKSKYILYFLEDYFIKCKIDTFLIGIVKFFV